MTVKNHIDIYKYCDYRLYLQDCFNFLKESNHNLSQRYAASKIGLDPSTLTKIIKGKRKLSFEQTIYFTEFLKLPKSQKEFFELLVRYDHAQTETELEACRKKIELRQRIKIAATNKRQAGFYEKWYHTIIRELLHIIPSADLGLISQMLIPKISLLEAKQALELLEELGIVDKNSNGEYSLASRFITTGSEVPVEAIHAFQKQMMELAKKSLDMDKNSRDVSTLSLSLSSEGFYKVKEMITEFRKQLIEVAQNDLQPLKGVFQINFQAFPVAQLSE